MPKTVAGRYPPGAVREPIKVCLVMLTWGHTSWLGGGGDGILGNRHTKPIGIAIRQPIEGKRTNGTGALPTNLFCQQSSDKQESTHQRADNEGGNRDSIRKRGAPVTRTVANLVSGVPEVTLN